MKNGLKNRLQQRLDATHKFLDWYLKFKKKYEAYAIETIDELESVKDSLPISIKEIESIIEEEV